MTSSKQFPAFENTEQFNLHFISLDEDLKKQYKEMMTIKIACDIKATEMYMEDLKVKHAEARQKLENAGKKNNTNPFARETEEF